MSKTLHLGKLASYYGLECTKRGDTYSLSNKQDYSIILEQASVAEVLRYLADIEEK